VIKKLAIKTIIKEYTTVFVVDWPTSSEPPFVIKPK
jgi:hypothetical protein